MIYITLVSDQGYLLFFLCMCHVSCMVSSSTNPAENKDNQSKSDILPHVLQSFISLLTLGRKKEAIEYNIKYLNGLSIRHSNGCSSHKGTQGCNLRPAYKNKLWSSQMRSKARVGEKTIGEVSLHEGPHGDSKRQCGI